MCFGRNWTTFDFVGCSSTCCNSYNNSIFQIQRDKRNTHVSSVYVVVPIYLLPQHQWHILFFFLSFSANSFKTLTTNSLSISSNLLKIHENSHNIHKPKPPMHTFPDQKTSLNTTTRSYLTIIDFSHKNHFEIHLSFNHFQTTSIRYVF